MKKLYTFLIALVTVAGVSAQCVIDPSLLPASGPGIYPSAQHLPHIVKDSLYDQTVQGRIQDQISQTFGGIVNVTIRVDSVRLDSILGLPAGITWVGNPTVLYGGQTGCVEFTGTTSDTAGTYPIRPIGMIWAHLTAPLVGLDKDTFSYGSLSQLQPWRNFFVVVDSAQLPLTLTTTSRNLCYGETGTGRATVTATGGSPTAPYTYLWDNGRTSYTLDTLNAGTYNVTVTSGTETATATIVVVQEQTPLTVVTSTNGGSNGADGTAAAYASGGVSPYTFFWSNGGGQGDSIFGLAPGTYRVTVRDSFNCTVRDSVVIQNLASGINDMFSNNTQLSLFPNPTNSLLNVVIESPSLSSSKLEVMDMTGRIVYNAPISVAGKYNHTIDVKSFSPGIYVLQLSADKRSIHQRFVVTH